ncbi:MAG TPA: sulfite exporter TauE/SafE family protein [Usitatibacter sp.]|nr:sulfite exporter TauE/SafE family protein [Usitatibacter sp.]
MTIELSELSPWLLLVAPIVVVVAYTVFGLSGFGSTVVSVPILAHFLPVQYVVPLMALLDLASAAFIGTSNREHISKEELKRLAPFMFVGFALGVTVLVGVPDRYLRIALGAFAAVIGVHGIFNPALTRKISALWCVPAGIIGGAVATIFGAGGPIYSTYLNGRLDDKSQIRSTLSTLISLSAFSRAIIYAISGLLLHLSILAGGVVLAPFAWIGVRIGSRIHVGLTQAQMRRAVGGLLVFTGGSLLVRALSQ